jgi:hypothetical protein
MRLEPARLVRKRVATTGTLILLAVLFIPAPVATAQVDELTISADADVARRDTGDPLIFTTSLRNDGSVPVTNVIVAMNIVNLDSQGDVVDPEDWSPERTQYVPELGPSTAVELSWRVNPILAGDYMIYMVAVPAPGDVDATSDVAASPGIHLVVGTNVGINPGGVLPIVVGVPVLIGFVIALLVRRQRRLQEA